MSLPASIWIKFKNTHIRVTYLGDVHDLFFVASTFGSYGSAYLKILSGNLTTGTVLTYALDEAPEFTPEGGSPVTYDVRLTTLVDGTITNQQIVGTVTFSGITVTAVTGSVTAAEIIYANPSMPKLLRVPKVDSYCTISWANYTSTVTVYKNQLDIYLNDEPLGTWSLSFDVNNVGTTDCPFVDWIGELSECVVKDIPESATWNVPADIDLTKPVIAECWGSGANGGNANADEGASGGGGGAYGSTDVATKIAVGDAIHYQVAGSNDGNPSYVQGADESFLSWAEGANGAGGGSSIEVVVDVSFAGGDGASGQPDGSGSYGGGGGSSAAEFANGNAGLGQDGGAAFPGSNMGPGGIGANIYDPASNGLSPGGGGGGGYSDGDQSIGGLGADGLIRFWYALRDANSGIGTAGRTPFGKGMIIRGKFAVGVEGYTYRA